MHSRDHDNRKLSLREKPPPRTATERINLAVNASGSASRELKRLTRLLHRFNRYLRRPFHAFADTVEPARMEGGRLITKTTGGTTLSCVFDHLRRTRPTKALVITDGFVERLPRDRARVDGVSVHFLISAGASDRILRDYPHPISRLPALDLGFADRAYLAKRH
jgi:hypothetical protein